MLQSYMYKASIDCSSQSSLFRPIIRSRDVCKLSEKDQKLNYTRTREIVLATLKLVAPCLNLGVHSLRAGGASSAAACATVNERCLKRHG